MPKYSDIKEKLFKELKEKYVNPNDKFSEKLSKFEKIWEKAEKIVNSTYEKQNTNKEFSEIVKDYVKEFYSYNASILRYFRNYKDKSFSENLSKAEKMRTKHRLEEFMKIYKNEKYEFNGKNRSLQNWQSLYLKGEIDDKTFYEIIKGYQNQNPNYDVANYRKNNDASRESTIRDRTE